MVLKSNVYKIVWNIVYLLFFLLCTETHRNSCMKCVIHQYIPISIILFFTALEWRRKPRALYLLPCIVHNVCIWSCTWISNVVCRQKRISCFVLSCLWTFNYFIINSTVTRFSLSYRVILQYMYLNLKNNGFW